MILIIDNTKNLNKAFMTPKIIKILEDLDIEYSIISTRVELMDIIIKQIKLLPRKYPFNFYKTTKFI